MDEATAMLMADKDLWLSTQPFISEDDVPPMTGQSRTNLLQVIAGTNTVYALAKEHKSRPRSELTVCSPAQSPSAKASC
jgi:hypothetical protein